MNRTKVIRHAMRLALGLAVLALAASPSFALELAAVEAEWSPDGGATQIPMWGFVEVADAATYTCPGAPVAWDPPVLTAPAGPLTINVKNCLGDDISVFIPGLAKASGDQLAPQVTTDGQGRERLTSFDDTVAQNDTGAFIWDATEGTRLVHSGTDVRTQVPMGLYGALVVTGGAYPAVAQDEVLLFSEIDPALNAAPAAFGGARVSTWNPQYFLINGQSYDPTNAPIEIGTSEDVLLRFVNAGLQTFVPTFDGGLFMDVIAEDGNLYPYPLTQYGLELTAGKTFDAIINAGSDGSYALYDRALHLANGGMIAHVQAGLPPGAPVANDDAYSVDEDAILTADGTGTNPAGVLANDGAGANEAVLISPPSRDPAFVLNADGTFVYTPEADYNGSDEFTYAANDGIGGPNGNTATVTITVDPVNDGLPAANDDSYQVTEGEVLVVAAPGVLGNDTDVDGDPLTAAQTGTDPPGVLNLSSDGSFDYTPAGASGAVEYFQYVANDGWGDSAPATVTVTVVAAVNIPPTANDDTTSTPKGTPLVNYNIVENDVDPDGSIDATSVVITTGSTTQRGGTVVNNLNGTITYTPRNPGWTGTDTFQYTVNDNVGATSNVATVRINVVNP